MNNFGAGFLLSAGTLFTFAACQGDGTTDPNVGSTPDAEAVDTRSGSSDFDGSFASPDSSSSVDLGSPDVGFVPDGAVANDRCRDFGSVRAFPGAVGFGAAAVGGRGGAVLYVDNLNDSGPGSLRAAVEASGPRTVVFSVGGTIELQSTLTIRNPSITIAGHSAPGGGIALRTHESVTSPAIISDTDEVILRHLRVRPGASTTPSNSVDALTITGGSNIIVAHCSFSWATDENVNFWYDASDISVQDSIISEALFDSTHIDGAPHSKGLISGPDNERISIVRNLFASNDDRSPLIQSNTSYELVNNLIYNGYQVGTSLSLQPNTKANLIGNVYLPGPDYRPSRYQIIVYGADGTLVDESLFVDDNISPRSEDGNPWAAIGWGGVHGGDYNGSPLPESVRSLTPFPMSDAPVTPIPAADVGDLLATVGATLPARDEVDARIVADVMNGTGGLVDSVAEAGGWPELAEGTAPADADRDGMPDAWESVRGLDPANPEDSAGDRDGDGYTNLEEYLECL